MGTKHRYQQTISNPYLGETKVISGNDPQEVQSKIAQQHAKWQEKEARQQEKYRLLALQDQATLRSQEAQERLNALRELLVRGLRTGKRFDWSAERDNRTYVPFAFDEIAPTYEQFAQHFRVPRRNPLIEQLFPKVARSREQMEANALNQFQTAMAQYEARKTLASINYEKKRSAFEQEKAAYNKAIAQKQKRFEEGDAEAISWVAERVMSNLNLPEGYGREGEVAFDTKSGTIIISMQLPSVVEIPKINGYKFVSTRKVIEPIELKQKDVEHLYDSIIYQIALLTLHQIFRNVYVSRLCSVVFNGWVTGINPATGKEFTSCILSVRAEREAFEAINLERVDPKLCIRSLKGIVAGPLAQLAPVRPIMELDTSDERFVESREILANLNATDNLATMDWGDFEHLVRELFSKVFGGYGSEVRVTQASRDGGVDAIAFDPDPIRGGKFVIQAKRYNKVVPVSSVRDLYGTMINEGAVKGILVTTSYFGNDSREFVKDKPITLIDGANLIHMFQEHGYNVKIELQP